MYLIIKAALQNYRHENEARDEVESVYAHQYVDERARGVRISTTEERVPRYEVTPRVQLPK